MRTMVTGGAGFIGSHVAHAYVAAGHDVVVIDDQHPQLRVLAERVEGFARDGHDSS